MIYVTLLQPSGAHVPNFARRVVIWAERIFVRIWWRRLLLLCYVWFLSF